MPRTLVNDLQLHLPPFTNRQQPIYSFPPGGLRVDLSTGLDRGLTIRIQLGLSLLQKSVRVDGPLNTI